MKQSQERREKVLTSYWKSVESIKLKKVNEIFFQIIQSDKNTSKFVNKILKTRDLKLRQK